MGHKLKVGDKVKLSAHALRIKGNDPYGIGKEFWVEAKERNNKDTYVVQEIDSNGDVTLGLLKSGKGGVLTDFVLYRDWVKIVR